MGTTSCVTRVRRAVDFRGVVGNLGRSFCVSCCSGNDEREKRNYMVAFENIRSSWQLITSGLEVDVFSACVDAFDQYD